MKRILQLFGNRINLGDWGSALGIRQMIRAQAGDAVEFSEYHLSLEPAIDEAAVLKINDDYDALVIGGGGLYYKKGSGPSDPRWPLGNLIGISKENLKKLKIPIILYAVGINQDLAEKKRFSEKNYRGLYFSRHQAESIRFLNDIAALTSARDAGTKAFIEGLLPSRPIPLVPCPSMFIGEPSVKGEKKKACVAVSLKNDASTAIQDNLLALLTRLAADEYHIAFIPHGKGECPGRLQGMAGLKIMKAKSPIELMKHYEEIDFMIGMRGHAAIFSFGALKPFISLSYNLKNDYFADMTGMKDYLIRMNAPWSTGQLIELFSHLSDEEKVIRQRFKTLKGEYLEMNRTFARSIVEAL